MKHLTYVFLCIFFCSCSHELNNKSSDYGHIVEYEQTDIEENLGPYSGIFFFDHSDASLVIEIYDDFLIQNQFTLSTHFWDYFDKRDPQTGTLSIGELTFEQTNVVPEISFTPAGEKELFFTGSNTWHQKVGDGQKYLNSTLPVHLEFDGEVVFDTEATFPMTLHMSAAGTPSEQFEGFTVCSRANSTFTWTKGANASDGVLLMMRYTGRTKGTVFDPPAEGKFRLILLEDDGSETLPADIFEGIPANAFVDFEVWRGVTKTHINDAGASLTTSFLAKGKVSLILED